MKKAALLYLSRLVRAHGSYSHTARAIGITPRYMRYMRRIRSEDMPPSCNRMLTTEGKLLLLRSLLRELRCSGALTTAALSAAWKTLRTDSSASDVCSCYPALAHSSSGTPPRC